MAELARLGRPGQWILHNEDIYVTDLDTRPQTRNPDEEVRIRGLTYYGAPINRRDLVWAGKRPAPDFLDVTFWDDYNKSLDEKLKQAKARIVQPRFTPEELQVIESLEAQPRHYFRTQMNTRRRRMADNKTTIFVALFGLAKLGRPGQWILHSEEFYHPVIDTRPQTRAAEKCIVVRDEHFVGDRRIVGEALFANFELTWAGDGPTPDFDDSQFWEEKSKNLRETLRRAEKGDIEPQFNPDELRVLEAMEGDEGHAFAKYLTERLEAPPPAVIETEEEQQVSPRLGLAKQLVLDAFERLWYYGLPGKWVLHNEDLYLPEYDTRFRERYDEDEDGDDQDKDNVLIDSDSRLRFDTRFRPLPDFSDVAFWEEKRAELRNKEDEITAGRLTTHNFTEGELLRIELLDRVLEEQLEYGLRSEEQKEQQKTRQIAAWVNGKSPREIWSMPAEQRTPSPSPSPSVDAPSEHRRRGHAADVDGDATQTQSPASKAPKRKRTTINGDNNNYGNGNKDDDKPRHIIQPAKRSKMQPPLEPSPAVPNRRRRSRKPPSTSPKKTQRRPADPPANPPPRRSPRIAAQQPRRYLYK
ncbi:hypothetical protein HMPREF1624_05790 [Sporothrix schenckii ATCC 58251]|uniref:Uncharacterized protein n=1 Tax=Sporothrix schenckii (strain ATCC 58251 / de Perez 2211183) TaxID=1391915 RepID=U7PS97_SPOS1|nr:hypothetical protein HMPREF1624_05790 [Sporothrix schenckii ATCC 58251]